MLTSTPNEARRPRRWLRIAGLIIAALLVVLVIGTVPLMAVSRRAVPPAEPRPAASYEEATNRVAELQAADGEGVMRPTLFFDQGRRTETAVVLFHGYTNNPEQFERIGRAFHAAGYNVLIPRLPEHGQEDLMTRDLSKITAARLAASANQAVDIAAGLGEDVEVVGLSGGGTLAASVAHDRDEVTSAIIISPLFGVDILPGAVTHPIVAWSRALPDIYMWWDPTKRDNHEPPDAYPRYSLKSISAFFEVAYDFAGREPSRTDGPDRVVLVTNAADRSIDEEAAREAIVRELEPISGSYEESEYPQELGYAHDLIDPDGLNGASIDEIYAELFPYLGLEYDPSIR